MYVTEQPGQPKVVDLVEPPDEFEVIAHHAEAIDEDDMPSSSRSMSLLIDEAVAAIEKYPESGEDVR